MAKDDSTISSALEDCLEAILRMERENRAARVRDLAASLSVHKSTVTAALRALSGKGMVNYKPYALTTLTPKGRRIAETVTRSHRALRRFLKDMLFVEDSLAESNACRLEHGIDREVLDRLLMLAHFAKYGPGGAEWLSEFEQYVADADAAETRRDEVER